jgi:hypothetical protein
MTCCTHPVGILRPGHRPDPQFAVTRGHRDGHHSSARRGAAL